MNWSFRSSIVELKYWSWIVELNYWFVKIQATIHYPTTLKYWDGVQWGQSYHMGRRCLFSLGWSPF